ncbi:MAG TPA: LLM class flavin-dependent oxidoreductase [Sporichthyaceae bacterium]|jgi:phthiodiolone/phenolphthiodiolone dimycocerosates ketoreductase|nr:LLM class flavin-dependent oxidoreductase [Sporichthyaceae bacterium]
MSAVRTGIGLWGSRYLGPKMGIPYAQALEATGQIDQVVVWDQLQSWWPDALWTPENSPMAAMLPDMDSVSDPFITIAFALCGLQKMGFAACTDAIRREPPELAQTMSTLATATSGKATLSLGAGEVRHVTPFGRKRSVGLKRLNEALQILRLLWDATGPVSFEGEIWTLKDAWIGAGGRQNRPEVVAMGGGPKLIEMALKHADGMGTGAPFVYADPARYGAAVADWKRQLQALGRSAEEFTFALHHITFILADKDEFEQYVDNPLLKWYAATGGRIKMADWAPEGIESVMPLDWHYALHMKPNSIPFPEIQEIISRVSPEMVRKTFFHGTPADIAAEIKPFVKAGANLNLIADLAPLLMPVDPAQTIEASAEICRLVKES